MDNNNTKKSEPNGVQCSHILTKAFDDIQRILLCSENTEEDKTKMINIGKDAIDEFDRCWDKKMERKRRYRLKF